MRKVGIFSGTFDPIHDGHLDFARQALGEGLDKVFFLVEPQPRRKQGVRAFEHRQRMVELAIRDEPAFGTIYLEQERFTPHKTLPLLQARFKGAELYMLMGDDMLHHLGDWPHVEELLRGVRFMIGRRRDSRAEVRARLKTLEKARGLSIRWQLFDSPHSDYASSHIRLSYKRNKTPVGLCPAVQAYIESEGLYAPA